MLIRPGQKKNGQKVSFLAAPFFFNSFLWLAAEKKDSKNGAARNFFGPSYFLTALVRYVNKLQ